MLPFPALFARGQSGAVHIASAAIAAAQSPTPASMGAGVGDLAIAFSIANPQMSSGSGGAWSNPNGGAQIAYKVLTAADVAAPLSNGNTANWTLSIYRGAVTMVQVVSATAASTGPGQSAPGFVKSINHAGLFAFTGNQHSQKVTDPITGPPTWSQRAAMPALQSNQYGAVFDRLPDTSPLIDDNQPTIWTCNVVGTDTNAAPDFIRIYELRTA